MIKVIHLAEDGSQVATIEVDDFTVEVVYSGIADMLREAAANATGPATTEPMEPVDLPRDARLRREKILTRLHD